MLNIQLFFEFNVDIKQPKPWEDFLKVTEFIGISLGALWSHW